MLLHFLYPIAITGTPEVAVTIDNLDIAGWQRARI